MIAAMHAELVESLRLGLTVFVRGDAALREARRLVARKRLLRRLEAEAAEVNIRALNDTTKEAQTVLAAGVDSGILLRMVRDLRRVHSHIAALAYPVLERAAAGEDSGDRPTPLAAAGLLADVAQVTDRRDRH